MTDMDGVTVYDSGEEYDHKEKVSYGGYVYQSLQDGNVNKTPDASSSELWWENVNELACGEVVHIIDHTGYHMTVKGRRKFIVTGED